MWWVHSIKENNPLMFAIKTGQYAFVFDYETLNFTNFLIEREDRSYHEVLKLRTDELFDKTEKPNLSFGIETDGRLHSCRASSLRTEDCQLVHSGRFLQHRFINWIPELTGCDPHHSGLDIVAWSDRLSVTLRITPSVNLRSNSIVMHFTVPDGYREIPSDNGFKMYRHKENESGYIMKVSDGAQMSVSGNTVTARLISSAKFRKGEQVQAGLVIYPVADVRAALPGVIRQETVPATITAQQIQPVDSTLCTGYDSVTGWHTVELRNDVTGDIETDNRRMERVPFVIENTSPYMQTVRLNFVKKGEIHGITGISGMLRDSEGYPSGISMQLSKNWHKVDFNDYGDHLYGGPWYHGITVLNVPAESKVELEYTGVNALWGGVPAASHAQLCLVGWSHNQQWDEAAIGAWGESICYEPDMDQASAPVLDMRPLLTVNILRRQWGWTGNVGGADFFNLRKTDGKRAWHTAMKTHYRRYCPNLTEVTYAGEMLGGKASFRYTASTGRSDDMTRGIYHIRMDVHDHIEFDELNIFQMGAPTYNYALSKKMAWGNEHGLVREWETARKDAAGDRELFAGRVPWMCFYDSHISERQQAKRYIGADRGFVVRSWQLRINGREDIPLYLQEQGSTEENRGLLGATGSIAALTLPEDCGSLSAGDYIEAVIEVFIVPLSADDYYGQNRRLQKILKEGAGTWLPAFREAEGNNISVKMRKGRVEQHYPVVIAAEDNRVQFTLTGGAGFVPVVVRALSTYRAPVLYEKTRDGWEKVDQSQYGNDFWQMDFDPVSGTWECIYNLNMDMPETASGEREFKFELVGS
jgi:hypothetical protein